MTKSMTLDEWWGYVKTDKATIKAKYFLRNYGGMGFSLKTVLEYLKTKTALVCHRRYAEDQCDVAGCYSIQDDTDSVVFRIDPTTPTTNGPRPYPSVVLC